MGEELKNDRDYNNWNIPDEIDEDFNGEAPVSDEEKAKMQEFLGEVKEEKMEKKYMDRGKKAALPVGALMGCLGRFLIHFLSGITIYAILIPTEILGLVTGSAALYSLLYNSTYMLPNTILAVVLCALLQKPMQKLMKRE